MERKTNPLSLSVLSNLRLGSSDDDEKRVLTALVNRALTSERNRQGWLDRQRALSRLRFGVRTPKTFPWKGASNLAVPFVDHAIRKYKPTMMRLIVEPDPIVEFVGTDQAAIKVERTAEIVFNWLFKTEMEAIEPLAYLIDSLCHRGFAFMQVGWEYRTEYECRLLYVRDYFPNIRNTEAQVIAQRLAQEYDLDLTDARVQTSLSQVVAKIQAGAEFVKLAFRRVIDDRPAVWDRDAVQLIAPPRCTDIGNAEWIVVQHVLSIRDLKQREADGLFSKGSVEKVLRDMSKNKDIKSGARSDTDVPLSPSLWRDRELQNERERIWGVEDEDNILIWECYHWYDHNNDGLVDRTVTWLHPRSMSKLRSMPYPYPFHQWPLVKYDFEKVNRRWHSPRGITQMLMDLQLEINAQHNARIDGMTLRNAPTYQMPVLGQFMVRNFRATPGTIVHTKGGAKLEPLQQDRQAFPEQFQEENSLRALGEHYIGIFDAAITSPVAQTKPRTATEISAIVQYTAATATFDAILFQLANRKLYSLVWELFMDLGPNEVKLKVSGTDPKLQKAGLPGFDPEVLEEQLVTVRKSDINKKFKLIPTGTVGNTNRALELSNAREAMAMYVNDMTGFIDAHAIREWHIGLLAQPRWSRRILRSPKDAQILRILMEGAEAYKDPEVQAALGVRSDAPGPDLPRQEIAQSGQSGAQAQQP